MKRVQQEPFYKEDSNRTCYLLQHKEVQDNELCIQKQTKKV
jgi:hypothetical protein